MFRRFVSAIAISLTAVCLAQGQEKAKPLHELQQEFEDLQFGLFTHYALPTYVTADWSDPDLSPEVFKPTKLDCGQWADAALSANMSFGCISVKHHNGFCLWDTETTDYNVMNSPYGKDLLKEYVDAFRSRGLKVMFHFSILDTHARLRKNMITPEKVEMVKRQLTELMTGYGPVTAIIFDGYEAPWGRISYEDVNFQELYGLIKSLQPNCLVMDMNSSKYPSDALFYTDIKFYEMGAGQRMDEGNSLPSMACLPIQRTWFWKEDMPSGKLRDPKEFVSTVLDKFPQAHCSFVLNVAPNREGLIDDNALEALKTIGKLWKKKRTYSLPECEAPITQKNIAKNRPAESSWSEDMMIMDLANDDDFETYWLSSAAVENPWWEVGLDGERLFDMVTLTEPEARKGIGSIKACRIEYRHNGRWETLADGPVKEGRVKVFRFATVRGDKVRVTITGSEGAPGIAELGVYEPYEL